MHSVKERVFDSFLVPKTVNIENKEFFGFWVTPDKIGVKSIHVEQEGTWDNWGIYFFEVANADKVSLDLTEHCCFVENNLLGVGEKLSMESKVLVHSHFTRVLNELGDERQDKELRHARNPASKRTDEHVVNHARSKNISCLGWSVEVNTVFWGVYSVETSFKVRIIRSSGEEFTSNGPNKFVLQERFSAEPMVSWVLVSKGVVKDVITIWLPSCINPLMKLFVCLRVAW